MYTKNCLEEFKIDCELRRLSKRTIKGYYNNILLFLQYTEMETGSTQIEQISTVHIRKYMQYLIAKGLSPTYANGILKGLRVFFKYAVEEEYITVNPALKVKWQKEGKVIIETFTDAEVLRLLNAFGQTDYLSMRNKLILATAFDTGARNTEICDICNDDIRGNVLLIHGKGNKERFAPLTPYLKKLMAKYERERNEYFHAHYLQYQNYFLSRTGKPLTKEALECIFNKANKTANIRDNIRCSPHTARHYYAQSNLKNGLDVYSLSRLLGHENINITKRYLQSMQDNAIVSMAVRTSPLSNLKL